METLLEAIRQGRLNPPLEPTSAPSRIQRALQRGLSHRREDRYGSMEELLDKLTSQPRSSLRRLPLIGAVAAVAVILIVALFAMKRGRTPPDHVDAVAMLPLKNLTGDPLRNDFVDGMTEALIKDLEQTARVNVISLGSIARYKDARKTPVEIAKELNVDVIIEGRVAEHGQKVEVSATLIHASNGKVLSSIKYEKDRSEVGVLQAEFATAIVTELDSKLTPRQQTRLARIRATNFDADEACLKGQHFLDSRTETSIRKGMTYFEEALRIDPHHAPAYSGLAQAYYFLGSPATVLSLTESARLAKEAALKAIALDDSLAEPYTTLGIIDLNINWDWPAAEREFRRAIELNPNHARAHRGLATYLAAMKRMDESLVEARRAHRLDPLSVTMQEGIGEWYLMAGQYDQAIVEYRKALDFEPNHATALAHFANVLHHAGRYEEALAHLRRAFDLSGNRWHRAGIAHQLVHLGRTGEAQAIMSALIPQAQSTNLVFSVARFYAAMGQRDEALQWLERAYEARAFGMINLNHQPDFDSMRSDARFQDIVRRVGLPQ